jgi:hypothetical protein
MPTPWGKYPQPIGTVRERLLSRCRQEDRGFDTRCLVWYGELDKFGYGKIKDKGKYVPAHWVLAGKPPDGLEADHLCHVRACVRPSHIEFVTRSENTLRRQDPHASRRVITEAQRTTAAQMLRDGKSGAEVANVVGLSLRSIGRIRKEVDNSTNA